MGGAPTATLSRGEGSVRKMGMGPTPLLGPYNPRGRSEGPHQVRNVRLGLYSVGFAYLCGTCMCKWEGHIAPSGTPESVHVWRGIQLPPYCPTRGTAHGGLVARSTASISISIRSVQEICVAHIPVWVWSANSGFFLSADSECVRACAGLPAKMLPAG